MSAEVKKEIHLEIAHVLFLDVVGFSKLLINDQSEILEQLNQLVRETPHFREAEAAGKLIRLSTGDGMALVFSNSAEAPVECALEISKALQSYPQIQLRMGVHSGPVNAVSDVNDRSNVTGAGINVAQRVMDCGDAGHILLSKHVAEDLEQYRQWQPCLHDLGECDVKHGARVSVVNLYTDDLGNPELPEKFKQQTGRKKNRTAAGISGGRPAALRWVAIATVILMLAAIGSWLFRTKSSAKATSSPIIPSSEPAATPAVTIQEKSIAVLPFENLSEEKANAFFADGVQDEILTDLSKVADLKVISRTSVVGYRDVAGRNLRKIGQELGVARLLEGSVQRSGNRVRVNAQLIDARTDAHLWAQTYDRDLADVFAIQSEIAKAIADQLQAKLSPNEKSAIEQAPTRNVAAFDFYTRARSLGLNISFTAVREDNLRQAVDLLNQAIARDPNFFLAYTSLAEAHDQLYSISDRTPARLALAEAAVARLRELRPDAGETHLAVARHRYYAFRDYVGARAELAAAAQSLPNEPAILSLAGFIDRRAGKWEESLRELTQAVDRDPRNIFIMQQTALSYQNQRHYAEMAAVLDRALDIEPERIDTKIARAQVQLHWHADTRPLHDTIQSVIARDPSSATVIAENWVLLSLCERDPDGLDRALTALGERRFSDSSVDFDPLFGKALLKYLRGDSIGFRDALKVARTKQEEFIRQQPEYAQRICVLGVIDAMLGNKEDALKEGRRAMELTPIAKDALAGAELKAFFAIICAWAGEKDLAIEQLNNVTQIPCYLSYGLLKLEPYWDPLRGDPRFEKLVASLAPR